MHTPGFCEATKVVKLSLNHGYNIEKGPKIITKKIYNQLIIKLKTTLTQGSLG